MGRAPRSLRKVVSQGSCLAATFWILGHFSQVFVHAWSIQRIGRARARSSTTVRAQASLGKDSDVSDWFSFGSSVEIVGASARQAYSVYAHLPNHPQWSSLLAKVQEGQSNSTSVWSLRALGLEFSWTALTTMQEPGKIIAWESTSGLPNKGQATFENLPGRDAPACTVKLMMRVQMPWILRRVFQSNRLSTMAAAAMSQDLERFREVVLSCDRSAECEVLEEVLEDPILVNSTNRDSVGSCQVVMQRNGRIEFELRGFGTTSSTCQMLEDLSVGMAALPVDEVNCTAFIDMTRGVGCSPMAVPAINKFLQRDGQRI
ncbi:unnamed protein product, partial [Polarella glacialis]